MNKHCEIDDEYIQTSLHMALCIEKDIKNKEELDLYKKLEHLTNLLEQQVEVYNKMVSLRLPINQTAFFEGYNDTIQLLQNDFNNI